MLLVDLSYKFECDWFAELSDNKLSDNKLFENELSDNELSDNELSDNELSDNNLASELVGHSSFSNQSQLRKIVVILMIKPIILYGSCARSTVLEEDVQLKVNSSGPGVLRCTQLFFLFLLGNST